MKQAKKLPLTKECHHWRRIGEVPWDLQKYWQQRHTIFSNYNEGVYMTHDAWYGVTPEPVAIQIANDIDGAFPPSSSFSSSSGKTSKTSKTTRTTIVDLFAGAGANAISFALQPHPDDDAEGGGRRRWDRVIAVEQDAATLACAQHNAALHGLGPGSGPGSSILWVLGDSFEFLKEAVVPAAAAAAAASDDGQVDDDDDGDEDLKIDPATTVLFASPPWGGPGYSTDAIFDSNTMEPYNLATLHGAYRLMDHALYLPRTSDLRQIARLAPVVDDDDLDGEVGQEENGNGNGNSNYKGNKTKNRKKIEVVQYCVEGASKALVAYIPAAAAPPQHSKGQDGDGDTHI